MELNICRKFVLQYRCTTSFAEAIMIDFKLGQANNGHAAVLLHGLAEMSYLLQMKIDAYRQKSILQVILLNYPCSNPKEYLIL